MRLLVVEDEKKMTAYLRRAFREEGHAVEEAHDGEEALSLALGQPYDAIVLDLNLPRRDGLSVLRQLRASGRATPVLILSARGQADDRITGLNLGADDYLPKPFAMEELLARLRAILRRRSGLASPQIRIGNITLDTRLMRVSRNGVPLALSPQEYRLVAYLMHHPGRVVPQQELAEQLQGDVYERESNAVEVLVGRVRRKLGPDVIETHRGFGYLIAGANRSGP